MDRAAPRNSSTRAVAHVAARARGGPIDPALRITVHFHPERVLAGWVRDGRYRSQFETGTSNGGLTAHTGGDRWRWESRIFGGAYDEGPAADRPVYGALDVRSRPVGGAPRFGSAHARLRPEVLARATFCFPDSVYEPTAFGVADRGSELVTAALAHDGDPLDDYVEAHVHGPLRAVDVEAVVLDPSHRGTAVEQDAARLGVPVRWHPGFRLHVDELRRHPGYRGPEFVELGVALAVDGWLDPRILGSAVGDPQALKRVWHLLARFGELATPATEVARRVDGGAGSGP